MVHAAFIAQNPANFQQKLADEPCAVILHFYPLKAYRLCAFLGQPLGQPLVQLGGHSTDRASVHEAGAHDVDVRAPQAVAGEGFGFRIMFVSGLRYQT
jgi:hypothetical protein